MKILIVSDTYLPYINGGSYFILHLAHGLRDRGHQVNIMTISEHFSNTVREVDGIMEYRIWSIPLPTYNRFRFSPRPLVQGLVRRIIKGMDPDIIHLQQHFMLGRAAYLASKKYNIPTIGTNHSLPDNVTFYLHLPHKLEELLNEYFWWQLRHTYDHLDVLTTPTKTAADIAQQHLTKELIPVSNGIDLNRYHLNIDADLLRKRYQLPNESIILYTGRLDKEKHLWVLIRALKKLRTRFKAHLVITGIGGEQKHLKQLTKNLGLAEHITFTGFVSDEDFPAVYSLGDVFAISSPAELQSLVTMEALASGLPVVAVNAKALPELCHDGENGFLFNEDDVSGCETGLYKILSDEVLRKRMSEKSLEIISHHSLNNTITRYEELYEKAVAIHEQARVKGAVSSVEPKE